MRALIRRAQRGAKRALGQDRGAVAVVVAVSLVALLGVGAIAVDSGRNWSERRHLLTAVEAAALAAAHDYSSGIPGCTKTAPDYVARNYPGATMTLCDPHGDLARGTFGWVTVNAEVELDQIFGAVLGSPTTRIDASSSVMFGVPPPGGLAVRPMAVCRHTLMNHPGFETWQDNGGELASVSIPFTNEELGGCAPKVDCPASEEVRQLVGGFGSATYDTRRSEFVLTENRKHQAGAVMSNRRIDIRENFRIAFDVYLGRNDGGADGLAFVFHNDPRGPSALGNHGGGMGISGIERSIGVEFDTWQNNEVHEASGARAGDDPPEDHTAIYDPEHLVQPADYGTPEQRVLYGAANRLSPLVTLPNIEDRGWHEATLKWDAATSTLSYAFDGFGVASLNLDLAADHFGDNFAYFGFAGSTGDSSNQQKLRFTVFDVVVEGGAVQCDDPGNTSGSGNWGLVDLDGGSNANSDINDWIVNGFSSAMEPAGFGSPGALSGSHERSLKSLVDSGEVFAVPIYDSVQSRGANTILDVVAFVNVKLTDFRVTGPSDLRFLEFTLASNFENRECCMEIPTDGSYFETNQRATRVVSLNSDGTPKRS